jgi:hypothetical protein
MTAKINRGDIQIAYTMIETAKRIKPRRDGRHWYQQYFLYWTAFNAIYTTIARRQGLKNQLVKNEDGSIATRANGHVNIPEVKVASEREQLYLCVNEFDDQLKHALIIHQSTKYFINRTPYWEGEKIEKDALGQRVNGVLNVNHTTSRDYPVWNPIDIQYFEAYLEDPDDEETRDFLVKQIVDLLYTVRNNFMFGGRKLDDANDLSVPKNALSLLEMIVNFFTQ